jgi:hypothetical protein
MEPDVPPTGVDRQKQGDVVRRRESLGWESNPEDRGQNHSWALSNGIPGDQGGVRSSGAKSKRLTIAPLCKTERLSVQSAASAAKRKNQAGHANTTHAKG